jgi:hypothetical protein
MFFKSVTHLISSSRIPTASYLLANGSAVWLTPFASLHAYCCIAQILLSYPYTAYFLSYIAILISDIPQSTHAIYINHLILLYFFLIEVLLLLQWISSIVIKLILIYFDAGLAAIVSDLLYYNVLHFHLMCKYCDCCSYLPFAWLMLIFF